MLLRGGILVVKFAGSESIHGEHGLDGEQEFFVDGGIAIRLLDVRRVHFDGVVFFYNEVFGLAVKSRKVVADDFGFFGDERGVHRVSVKRGPLADLACQESGVIVAAFVRACVVDAAFDPGVGAVGVVLAHVRDGRIIRNVGRVGRLLESFAVNGERGIGHAFFIVDASEQAIKIFVDVFCLEFCRGFGVCECLV